MIDTHVGTWFRTITQLHPLQIAARLPHRCAQAVVGLTGIASGGGPGLRPMALSTKVGAALTDFARAESHRYERRIPWLTRNPRLASYEARYGLAADARGFPTTDARWCDATGTEPYVASVRARRLATAIARGDAGLLPHVVRAARAIFLAPEIHILGNHLIENGIGLVAASCVTQGLEADLWWHLGSAILSWQLPLQFYSDGMHDEGSMTYHLALIAGVTEARVLADAAGRAVPPPWMELVERGVGIALDYEAPGGLYPLFNDADYDAGPSVAQVVSLAEACGFHVREARTEAAFASQVGWAVLRNARAWCVMKAGPDGSPTQPGHVHADLLSIELWIDGVKVISDPGVTSYNDDAERAWCRSSAAHNGPFVNGEDSSEVWGAFRTGRRGRARVLSLESAPLHAAASRHSSSATVISREISLSHSSLEIHDCTNGAPLSVASAFENAIQTRPSETTCRTRVEWR